MLVVLSLIFVADKNIMVGYNFVALFKRTSFKNHLKRKKWLARLCLSLGWLYISVNRLVKNCKSSDIGAH